MIIVEITDTWSVIDKWWRSPSEWINREFAAVIWYGRHFIFCRETPDSVWRIWASNGE